MTSPQPFQQGRRRRSTSPSTGPTSTPSTSPTTCPAGTRSGPRGTSPDFPILGTGEYDWQGYNPSLHTLTVLPFAAHPHAIDPDFLVSWNNKQAPGWAAADDLYGYGPIYRSR